MNEATPQKFYPVSWDVLYRDARALAGLLHKKGPWKGIVAITRGGLIPATIVARDLHLRMVETVCVVAYKDDDVNPQQVDAVEVLKPPSANVGDGEGWLVVDDLVDSGRTLETLRKLMPKAHYATVYAKSNGKDQVETYVTEVRQDTWLYFPWEMDRNPNCPSA
ncbi:MAG: xanthine phosphoribosyltransferase [Alphaproteobacteria bacterium]|nr:xanthine phosphoribosyltransferase [Alphaproteobacteria bacterium]